jgi:hypothetical protein
MLKSSRESKISDLRGFATNLKSELKREKLQARDILERVSQGYLGSII